MILYLLLGSITFFIPLVFGYSVVKIINRIRKHEYDNITYDEVFFFGLLALSAITGFLSIFIPIGRAVFYSIGIITVFLFVINYKGIITILREALKTVSKLSKLEIIILCSLIFFVLTAVVHTITSGDTQTYHAQNIQWIQKYAVVPGLGNFHGRFASNSMFFVISAIFTFQIKDLLIFPLNGICYIILMIKLFTLYKKEYNQGTKWKAVFYIITLLISLLIMFPDLNTPSPDIICGTLIIYLFILIMNKTGNGQNLNFFQIILLNLLVFSCATYKLSSIFLVVTILFFLDKEIIKRSLTAIFISILVISPFIIRNYYLSGYLVYPFPAIDIFNVDWKIPLHDVTEGKLLTQGWAKIWYIPYPEVQEMKITDWIIPWFKILNFNGKLLVTINALSVITFIIMLFKKDFQLAKIQLIILINLIYWFVMAPDIRFAFGFIFLGFSLMFAYLVKLFEYSSWSGILKYVRIIFICVLIIVIGRRINIPKDIIRNPSHLILPAPFGTGETQEYYSGFNYRVAVPESGCFNVEIPCTNYPLTNVVLRGDDLQDGFKVITEDK